MGTRCVIVTLLVAACSNTPPPDEAGGVPLHVAAASGDRGQVETLLAAGASTSARDRYERTPLHRAAAAGHAGVCKVLLEAGAQIEARAWYGLRPLHWAAMRNQLAAMDVLVARGAILDARDTYGRTPLHVAASDSAVKLLLAAGATLEPRDNFGMTPLHTVRSEGGAQALLNAGADPAAPARDGRRPTDMTIATNDDGPQELLVFPGGPRVRLRGTSAKLGFLLVSVVDRPIRDLLVTGESSAATIETAATPAVLHPGQVTHGSLQLHRVASDPGGEHTMTVAVFEEGRQRLEIELPLDTRREITPEDRGLTQVGVVKVQRAPGALQLLAYVGAPVVLLLLWLLTRRRRMRQPNR